MSAGTYVTQAYVLDHLWVEVGLPHDLLENLEDNTIERSVLQATLAAFGKRCSDGEGDDNIVWVLSSAIRIS